MANTAKRIETPRADTWHEIEGRVFGQCVWQHVSQNRRVVMEGLMHRRLNRVMIVEKSYVSAIPRNSAPWPELGSVQVYDQVAPAITEWNEFENALQSLN